MRRLSWSGALALAFFGWGAAAEEGPALEGATPTVLTTLPSAELAPVALPLLEETVLSSGLRIWRGNTGGSQVEVCSSHRVVLHSEQERAALGFLIAIVERGGYRASGEDYNTLLTTRGLVSKASVRGDVVVFCTKGPAKELPLALWTARGRFARQALTERELEAERSRGRQRQSAPAAPETLALGRLRRVLLPTYESELELRVSEESRAKVTIDDVRRMHEQVLFSADSFVTIVGGFSDAVLGRLVTEHLALPKALNAAEETPFTAQTNYRYGLLEDVRIQRPRALFGYAAPATERRSMELALAVLAEKLNENRKNSKFRIETFAGPVLALGAEGADVKELEERKHQLEEATRATGKVDAGLLARAEKKLNQQRLEEFSERGGAAIAFWAASGEKTAWLNADGAEKDAELISSVERALRDGFRTSRSTTIELLPKGFQDPFQELPAKTHILEEGETLGTLAYRFGVSQEALQASAGATLLTKGAKLTLPKDSKKSQSSAPLRYRVKKGDTLLKIAHAHQVSVDELRTINQLTSPEVKLDQTLFIAHATLRKDEPLGFPKEIGRTALPAAPSGPASVAAQSASTQPSGAESSAQPSGVELFHRDSAEEQSTQPSAGIEPQATSPASGDRDYEKSKTVGEKTVSGRPTQTPMAGALPSAPEVENVKARPSESNRSTSPSASSPSEPRGREKKSEKKSEAKSASASNSGSLDKPSKKSTTEKVVAPQIHVVIAGDQLLKLAAQYSVSMSDLCEANRLKRDAKLYVGQRIKIPAGRSSHSPKFSAQK